MQTDHYHFITNWRVRADVDQVAEILRDPLDLPRWWPSVFIDVTKRHEGKPTGVGAEYGVVSRGWLPHLLRWQVKVTETHDPRVFTMEANGDMIGIGVCTMVQHGDSVEVTIDWEFVVRNVLVRILSTAVRPLIATNHRWAMSRGELSLNRELQWRSAGTDSRREEIAQPPGPMRAAGALATFGLVILAILLPGSLLLRILKRRTDKP